jgi:hypothetical protein
MQKFLGLLTGKKTIIVTFFGGILAAMPEWASALPPDASVLMVITSWVQAFWGPLAIIFGALKVNRAINGGAPTP